MNKAWKIVINVVLIAILLGVLGVAVGSITGAQFDRIYSVFDARYNVQGYLTYAQEMLVWAKTLVMNVVGALFG